MKRVHGIKILLVCFSFAVFPYVEAAANAQGNGILNSKIFSYVQVISGGTDENAKVAAARALLIKISSLDREELAKISDTSIDDVCLLLTNKNELVRIYAAEILEIMGEYAERALPKLRAAYKNYAQGETVFGKPGTISTGVSDLGMMRVAILKIERAVEESKKAKKG